MPTPDFILDLREMVGHHLLWLTGVTGVVRNADGEILLGRRSDNGMWALPSGVLDPGEQPAAGLVREIREETRVEARVDAVASVWTLDPQQYPNGDRAQYLDICFLCTHVAGEAAVGDDESLEVGWFPPDRLPEPMMERSRVRLERALAFRGSAWFVGVDGAGGYAAVPGAGAPLATLRAGDRDVVVRRAREDDLAAVVRLLADDQLGATREDAGDLTAYRRGLAAIDADPHQLLVVLDDGGEVVGCLQLTFIPGISHAGAWRAQVEGVRVAAERRGSGLGAQLLHWAVGESRRRGCAMVQLTTNQVRVDAHRFYERLGFRPSHKGFKLDLRD